jgi:hypothetical protein
VYVDESGMDERDEYGYGWCERGKLFESLTPFPLEEYLLFLRTTEGTEGTPGK